jgi:hypothetical protein
MNIISENLSNWLDSTLIFLAAMLIIGSLALATYINMYLIVEFQSHFISFIQTPSPC